MNTLAHSYPDDLSPDIYDEFEQFRNFPIECADVCGDTCKKKPKEVMTYFANHKLLANVFPNVMISIRIYLSLCVSVCNAERSFSIMARIKNCRRSTMSNIRLSDLTILSTENDLVRKLSFEQVIDKFAKNKARKKQLL